MQWVEGFKRRWNFAMRAITRSGKANEALGQTQLDSFSTRIQQVIHDHKIVKIFNADQTAVNFEMIPTKTLSKEGLKTVWVMAAGKDKERVSAMLMADADGIKYPAFIVMKTTKSKVPKNVQENMQQRNGFGKMFLRQKIEKKRPNERFNLKSPDRFDIVEWINLAWDALQISTIINGFVKCKIILNEELTDDREEEEEANSIDATDVAFALQSQGLLRGQPVDETSDTFFERPISE
ncbi:unnamed protein product [Aphanomyces euteiches]